MSTRLKNLTACGGIISVYALATLPVLLTFPPVWPDEVNLYAPAAALARGQGMGTAVLAGFLPGIDRYTYWQPPGYFFFLSLGLRLVAPAHHFVVMRLFSWLLGVVALLLGAAILNRLARNSIWALLGLVVLGTQVAFMQAANVGRMEMLSLASTMAALNAYLAYRNKAQRSVLALAGLFAGLALISHPAGILAGFVVVVHEITAPVAQEGKPPLAPLLSRERSIWKDAATFLGFAAVPFVPWLVYIMRAPNTFLAQIGAQSARKSIELGLLLTRYGYRYWLLSPFEDAIWPLGHRLAGLWPFHLGGGAMVPVLVSSVGVAALLAEGRHRVEAPLLGTWALAGYAINLFLPEFWYAVYFITPCCLLLGWAVAACSKRWVRAVALATLVVAATWNFCEDGLLWRVNRDAWARYRLYCSSLAMIIPTRSKVLLAAIPDPYFGWLAQDRSYQIYEFVPEGVPVDDRQAQKTLAEVDYVVGSDCCRPSYLVDYLVAHGKQEVNMGSRDFLSPAVVVWKLSRGPNHPAARRQKAAPAR